MATERKKAGRISPVLMGDYDDTTTYRRLDWVYYGGTSYICKKNNTIGIVPSNTERWQKIIDKISDMNITFTENTEREIYTSGESLSTIIGKIQKWLMSLKTVAFTGKYTDLSDTPISLKNPKSLKFTGGSVVEYDGSIEKSINIPTVPSSLKNPNALNIKFNGTSQASYDGSIAKEVNVTPANIGAVNTSALLNTTEQISANTNANNITGSLAAKAMMADYNNKINTINSNLAGQKYVVLYDGSISNWNGDNYLTINLTDAKDAFLSSGLVMCLFRFGGGNNSALGIDYGEISACTFFRSGIGNWTVGLPIIGGNTAYLRRTDKKLYVWCNNNPPESLPLREIVVYKFNN